MNTKAAIRHYIAKNILFSNNGIDLGNDESFLEEGIVDSTGVLELVLFVEDEFDVEVDDDEIVPDNFDTVNNLSAFIEHKIT